MSSSLSITKELNNDHQWIVTASVVEGGSLPLDIFIYKNTGSNSLGEYIGVCNLEEYQRLKTFTGSVIPNFGNKFVKYAEAKIILDINDDVDRVIKNLTTTVKALSLELTNSVSTTQIIPIP